MPIKVHYKNDPTQVCSIRPTPFIQISEAVLKNKQGTFGATYTITLTGTLLPEHGTPYALNSATDQIFDFFTGPAAAHHIGNADLLGGEQHI